MKFLKLLLAQSLLLLFFNFSASAQSDTAVLNHIIFKTGILHNNYPIEKVYLHFDKPYYALGDTIWFKAYLTVDNHQLSTLSKVINVDMVGSRDTLIQSLKLQVKNGVAWGNMAISQYVYKKGNYRVVAYTNWMNNNDPSYFFNKNITIGDAINNDVATQISLKSDMVNKTQKVTAGIYFKDADGTPYMGKKVSWTVIKEDETILKGKGETDNNGFINISFLNLKKVGLDSANMITVLDNGGRKQYTNTFPLKSIASSNDVQFFAEGGQLISGLKSKVAFKAINPNGLGIDVKGTITDNNNQVVAEFASTHLGMGIFTFAPEDGKTYTAKVTYADGSTGTPDLPKIETDAISLGLDNTDPNTLNVKIQSDPTFFKTYQGKTFFLLAKSSGVVCFAAKTLLPSQVYSASIPKSKFPTGIVQVTLFTDDGEPISERIAFINHHDFLNLSIAGDKPAYTTRQKVKLNITAKNGEQPVEGTFSISVIDDSKVPFDENAETTILTNLLLTSDIKGYVEKPNYYFSHATAQTDADLDVLLQTQGYRRFSYDGIMNNKFPAIGYLPEKGIDISGTLRASSGIPVFKGNVRVIISDKNYSANAITDADGRFKFPNLVFLDSAKVTLSARNNEKSDNLVLNVDNEAPQRIPVNINKNDEVLNIDSTLAAYLKNSKVQFKGTNTLKEVVIKDTKIVKLASHRDYSALASLSSEADHTIPGSQFKDCNSPLECLKGLAFGMTFVDGFFYPSRDYSQGKKVAAQIFLNDKPVDVNTLATLGPDEIESVEIFTKDELGLINSAYNTNGAIVVNTKKKDAGTKISMQDLKALLPKQNEVSFSPKGYAAVRTFYLPRYSGPRESQTNKVDARSTIYWNPNIVTDKTGAAAVEFFNADGTGTYRAIIEGIDNDGNIGRQVFRYTIK